MVMARCYSIIFDRINFPPAEVALNLDPLDLVSASALQGQSCTHIRNWRIEIDTPDFARQYSRVPHNVTLSGNGYLGWKEALNSFIIRLWAERECCGECGAGPFSSEEYLDEIAGFGGKCVHAFSILLTRYPHRSTDT